MEFMLRNIVRHSCSYHFNYISLHFLSLRICHSICILCDLFKITFFFVLLDDSSDAIMFLREKYSNGSYRLDTQQVTIYEIRNLY